MTYADVVAQLQLLGHCRSVDSARLEEGEVPKERGVEHLQTEKKHRA